MTTESNSRRRDAAYRKGFADGQASAIVTIPEELAGELQWAMHDAFEASEADTTAGKMIAVYEAVRVALSRREA